MENGMNYLSLIVIILKSRHVNLSTQNRKNPSFNLPKMGICNNILFNSCSNFFQLHKN